jgi:hypothetical protein
VPASRQNCFLPTTPLSIPVVAFGFVFLFPVETARLWEQTERNFAAALDVGQTQEDRFRLRRPGPVLIGLKQRLVATCVSPVVAILAAICLPGDVPCTSAPVLSGHGGAVEGLGKLEPAGTDGATTRSSATKRRSQRC